MWLNVCQEEGANIGLLYYYIQTNSRMQATFNPSYMKVGTGFNFTSVCKCKEVHNNVLKFWRMHSTILWN
jgi:hypothetical protein